MPVYAFVRRTGASVEDARDLTQAFFTTVLERGYFKHAQRERGRTFLLTAVAHFLESAEGIDTQGGGILSRMSRTASGDINWSRPTR